MVFCKSCGNELDENARFCYKCGARSSPSQPTGKTNIGAVVLAPFRIVAKGCLLAAGAFLGLIVIIVVIALIVSSGSDEGETGAIGQSVRTANWEIIVTTAPEVRDFVGEGFSRHQAAGKYVVVPLSITNVGNEGSTFNRWQVELRDVEDRTFDVAPYSVLSAVGSDLFLEQINPGLTHNTQVVFDVPRNIHSFRLKVKGALFEEYAIVELGEVE